MKHFLFCLMVIAVIAKSKTSFAQVAPEIHWKVMEQENAIWIYDSRQKELALQYAKTFQKVFPALQKQFVEFPRKTTFVISDYTDSPNGSATIFPYPLVTVFPVIPLPTSPIGETDDSLYEIMVHEYTHILNLYPVHGGMRLFHTLFGSLIHPNVLLPRWYVEGLAVYTESYYNPKGGRLRSQNFEGIVRAISAKNEWHKYPIDQMNEFIPDWLGGRRAYLLGGAYMHHLAETYGFETHHELNQASSRRLPYFVSGMLENKTGKEADELLQDTYKNLQAQADRQFSTLRTAPVSEGTRLPQPGNLNFQPVISPDGKYLAFISSAHNIPSSVHILKRDGKNEFTVEAAHISLPTDTYGVEHIAWSTDSKTLAFNLIKFWRYFYQYSDLQFYDLAQQKITQMTFGARVGDILFANDNKGVYFVQNTPGSKQLSYFDLATKKIRVLYTPPRFGTNMWSLAYRSGSILFIEQNSEKRVLKAYNVAAHTVTTVSESAIPTSLNLTPLGILYSSPTSGVDNLYLSTTDDFSQKRAVTNSLTRIIDGAIDPLNQALYYSEQREDGVYVYMTPADSWQKITGAPKVEPLLTLPQPATLDLADDFDATALKEKEFYPFRYLYPRYWMPYGYLLDGGIGLQASTSMADPLNKNIISLGAEWDSLTQKTGGSVSYTNMSTPVALSISAAQVYRYIYNADVSLKDTGASAQARSYIPGLNQRWTMGLEIDSFTTEFGTSSIERSGPGIFLAYNNSRRLGFEISPEQGTSFAISHQSFIKEWGNIGFDKTNASARAYFSKWLPQRHVLFTQLNATYAPKLNNSTLFTSTIGANFVSNTLIPPFLMRGYPTGTLLGNNVVVGNLEYRFPLANIYRGWKTFPVFVKQLSGAVVADTISLDGARYSFSRESYLRSEYGKWYWGYGAEAHLSCTFGYYLPITFTFGVYRGENRDLARDDYSTFFTFSL
ncbi:MAG: hypothetical protein K2Q26_14895 [Bdellovibrionales bacterium]|nr:hypothetical protein [Bdellovibrionales bacterium]